MSKEVKMKCSNCNRITIFQSDKFEEITSFEGSSFIILIEEQEFICEFCGKELYLGDII